MPVREKCFKSETIITIGSIGTFQRKSSRVKNRSILMNFNAIYFFAVAGLETHTSVLADNVAADRSINGVE